MKNLFKLQIETIYLECKLVIWLNASHQSFGKKSSILRINIVNK